MIYILSASHVGPQSTTHHCLTCQYLDPVELWYDDVDADSPVEAEEIGRRHLEEVVAEAVSCRCGWVVMPPGRLWWKSVKIHVTPKEL